MAYICLASSVVTAAYALGYLGLLGFVLAKNRFQFNCTNYAVMLLFIAVFAFQLSAVVSAMLACECQIGASQKLLLFESDIFVALIL